MTDAELNELEAKAIAAKEADGCERSLQTDTEYIKASRPWKILELIAELRQARKERDWLAYQLEKNLACYPPNDNDCSVCNRLDCTYTSHTSWLKAAKKENE